MNGIGTSEERQKVFEEIMDHLVTLDTASKSSGIGISLSQVRPQGMKIHNTYNGNNPINWFNNMFVGKKKWVVEYKFPFGVKHIDDEVQSGPPSWSDNRFERRIDAEKLSLKNQIQYIKVEQHSEYNKLDKETIFEIIKKLEQKLEKIEEEHPEWLI